MMSAEAKPVGTVHTGARPPKIGVWECISPPNTKRPQLAWKRVR